MIENTMNLTFHASMEVLDPFEEKLIWSGSDGDDEEENDCDDVEVVVVAFLEGSSTALGVVTAV